MLNFVAALSPSWHDRWPPAPEEEKAVQLSPPTPPCGTVGVFRFFLLVIRLCALSFLLLRVLPQLVGLAQKYGAPRRFIFRLPLGRVRPL